MKSVFLTLIVLSSFAVVNSIKIESKNTNSQRTPAGERAAKTPKTPKTPPGILESSCRSSVMASYTNHDESVQRETILTDEIKTACERMRDMIDTSCVSSVAAVTTVTLEFVIACTRIGDMQNSACVSSKTQQFLKNLKPSDIESCKNKR